MIEILDEIDRICKKHSLTYFLIGGTLLGAVRHEGYIPWDDDLDIAMPREDYIKFEEACKTDLGDKFFLHSPSTDPEYPMVMPKMRAKNTAFVQKTHVNSKMYQGIWVDIFPLDNAAKEKSLAQTFQAKLQGVIGSVRGAKAGIYDKSSFELPTRLMCVLLSPFSNSTLARWQTKVKMWNKNNDSEYFVSFSSGYGYKKQTIKKSVYYPARPVTFEGKQYSALNDCDFFLRRIYGEDYMQLPPEEKGLRTTLSG